MKTEPMEVKVKIPLERIPMLIGKNGKVKKRIEKTLKVVLEVDSSHGEISIKPATSDPSTIMKAKNVVLAIGRGFNPEIAFKLADDQYTLDIISLREYLGKSKKAIIRIKGRVIGKNGKAKEYIEEATNCKIAVYGHTVAIIGKMPDIMAAREAVLLLVRGAQHRTMYRKLKEYVNL